MKNDLTITTIQSSLVWENPDQNRENFAEMIRSIDRPTNIIVLPEMFSTGFSMDPSEHAEKATKAGGPTSKWMAEMAAEKNAVVTGSVAVQIGKKFYNRMYWVQPSGEMTHYDKRHLFSLAQENEHYAASKDRVVVDCEGWKVSLNICYDLRFPIWCRNEMVEGEPRFDVQIFCANWPITRAKHWRTLLQARAIENQAYVVGVNRVGEDVNEFKYSGGTGVFNFNGDYLSQHKDHSTSIKHATLSKDDLIEMRSSLPFLADGDNFTLKA
jgi:omega-amidase